MGLALVIIFFAVTGFIAYWNTLNISQSSRLVTHTHDVITTLDDLSLLMKDAETGQRGYILAGDEKYLRPYTEALAHIEEKLTAIERLTNDNANQQNRIPVLRQHIRNKLHELEETITLRRTRGFTEALGLVLTDKGKGEMDIIRTQVSAMQEEEFLLRSERLEDMQESYRIAIISGILTSLLGVLLSIVVAHLVLRASRLRQREEWLQGGEVGLSAAIIGEQRVGQIADSILTYLAEYCDAHVGAFFTKEGTVFRRSATYGMPTDTLSPEHFMPGDGLLGQAAKDKRPFVVRDVPKGYATFRSAIGEGNPHSLLISPAITDDKVNAVLELGFLHGMDSRTTELLERISENIAVAIRSAHYREHVQNLLEETQRQAEELQAQSEELRVNNEELEEQSRALKESQTRLEQQQAELEQTNAQLEEQAQLLEGQRDDLARAKATVQAKAQELEQASQYKSDFLANMSHELRTPLNSSLILAKLLADNPAGNLTSDQVKFAQTIQSSGNDLLMLINDILDLSKIEAGHMEVRPETVSLTSLAHDLTRVFEPMAQQKKLTFLAQVAPETVEAIETDRQRLEQIVKNLLSNAMKFTQQGGVTLNISQTAEGDIAFAVTDTGIGIPEEQQQLIFEAFRQADGTISRKFGGTGLGLSISRELTRLLGGTIALKSELGKGSTFTLTLPQVYDPDDTPAHSAHLPEAQSDIQPSTVFSSGTARLTDHNKQHDRKASASGAYPKRMKDDREKLTGDRRVILVVEDDASFANILRDLAHELDFQCLISTTAEEAVNIAIQYIPSAVILDVGLPDNSGLSVLDRLKRDSRTRHIPVHVVSASDYAQTALSLGAIGYMIKPVKRQDLSDTLKNLEKKLAQRMRRVLIVEDDAVQRDSVGLLLGSHDVETVGVGTAAECLAQLKSATFDCMVLDLSLPDASGYSLLETLSKEDAYSFPPVIVYTGRDLSEEEEQRLRRYSKSIIIKGAKSPERLLDEVTLFLHQVVAELPPEQQKMLEIARNRDSVLEGRRILVVEDDVRNVYALTSIFEPLGATVEIARNGVEALSMLEASLQNPYHAIDLVLMDVMMPEMDGMTATREIRKRTEWKKLPVIMLTAKAMKDDQERCLSAGANDYMAKPLDVEKLLSLVRVWMPR